MHCVKSVQKYGVFSGRYFPVFGPGKIPYLDTFHALMCLRTAKNSCKSHFQLDDFKIDY